MKRIALTCVIVAAIAGGWAVHKRSAPALPAATIAAGNSLPPLLDLGGDNTRPEAAPSPESPTAVPPDARALADHRLAYLELLFEDAPTNDVRMAFVAVAIKATLDGDAATARAAIQGTLERDLAMEPRDWAGLRALHGMDCLNDALGQALHALVFAAGHHQYWMLVHGLAVTSARTGQEERAYDYFAMADRATIRDSSSPSFYGWCVRGNTAFAVGDDVAACTYYERALAEEPKNLGALTSYCHAAACGRVNLERGLVHGLAALEQAPENATVLDAVGWLHYRAGRPLIALTYLGLAASKCDSPTVHERYALVLQELGREKDAQNTLAKFAQSRK